MKHFLWILALPMVLGCVSLAGGEEFDAYFSDRTMRVDLYHTGTKGVDIYSLDEVPNEISMEWWQKYKHNFFFKGNRMYLRQAGS